MFKKKNTPKLKCTYNGICLSNCNSIIEAIQLGMVSFNLIARLISFYFEISLDEAFIFLYHMCKSDSVEFKGIKGMLKE